MEGGGDGLELIVHWPLVLRLLASAELCSVSEVSVQEGGVGDGRANAQKDNDKKKDGQGKWRAGTDIVEWSVKKWRDGSNIVEWSVNEGLEPTLSNDRLKNEGLEPTLSNDPVKKWWARSDVVEWSVKKMRAGPTLSIRRVIFRWSVPSSASTQQIVLVTNCPSGHHSISSTVLLFFSSPSQYIVLMADCLSGQHSVSITVPLSFSFSPHSLSYGWLSLWTALLLFFCHFYLSPVDCPSGQLYLCTVQLFLSYITLFLSFSSPAL
jgi:hypothetical protein